MAERSKDVSRDFDKTDYPAALRDSIAADLKKRSTPSRPDGYTVEVEVSCRISACFFINDAVQVINHAVYVLPQLSVLKIPALALTLRALCRPVWVVSTAQMYMQQYYDRHSLKTSDRIVRIPRTHVAVRLARFCAN